ncbi:hypothetical protein C4K00_2223 [Pseudomonas synxantha]|nr:hypothetical protein C4K00_2223 [Pseudomonas synxantha]
MQRLDAVEQALADIQLRGDGRAQVLHGGQFQQARARGGMQVGDLVVQGLGDGLHHQLMFVLFLGVGQQPLTQGLVFIRPEPATGAACQGVGGEAARVATEQSLWRGAHETVLATVDGEQVRGVAACVQTAHHRAGIEGGVQVVVDMPRQHHLVQLTPGDGVQRGVDLGLPLMPGQCAALQHIGCRGYMGGGVEQLFVDGQAFVHQCGRIAARLDHTLAAQPAPCGIFAEQPVGELETGIGKRRPMGCTGLLFIETHAAQQQRRVGPLHQRIGAQRKPLAIHLGHTPGPGGFDLPGAAQAEQAQVRRVCAPEKALPVGCIQRQRRQRRRGVGADGNHWALVRHRPLVRGLEHLE